MATPTRTCRLLLNDKAAYACKYNGAPSLKTAEPETELHMKWA